MLCLQKLVLVRREFTLYSNTMSNYTDMIFGACKKSRDVLSHTRADLHVHIVYAVLDSSVYSSDVS